MSASRIVFASFVAALIGVSPYVGFAYWGLASFATEGGAPAQGVQAGLFIILTGMVLATVFLLIARMKWKEENMVVRQHLFGWPIGFAALFLLLLVVPGWLSGFSTFLLIVATALASGFAGVAGAALWLKLSYTAQEEANQTPEPTP